ncbi:winged helix-turn-helix transcriptional regulator [Sphingosinicella rhizophila]|uniref:Winged helix-turn-helix transcriptional regulator n=1 Tax=Sphingosinicella rhizophila TaxID=3050082 RepID=A0ABU3Q6J1_9SPHN|nr:winged helix-turn-helix transcriptional regulator [Sphingosinicella sp. GR2756]MDT9599024.1 winged helix-turn-helix transcriptional regulator [Sphingosinicella sp. GR2756]
MKLKKLTGSASSSRRRYDDACGTAHGLDLIGERWALLVMRELMLGPKRFSDIRGDLPGISANVLTQRLEGLEAAGLVVRRKLPPPASAQVYELTEWGYEAEPIVQVLGRWAVRSPDHDPNQPISPVSLMLSFRTMMNPERAGDTKARIGFRLGPESFLARIADGGIQVVRGPIEAADLILAGPPAAIAAAVYGGQSLEALEADGILAVEGDRDLARRFTTFFPLPPKAERRG